MLWLATEDNRGVSTAEQASSLSSMQSFLLIPLMGFLLNPAFVRILLNGFSGEWEKKDFVSLESVSQSEDPRLELKEQTLRSVARTKEGGSEGFKTPKNGN